MSLYHYEASKLIGAEDYPFYALVMAAMRKADTDNLAHLKFCWPNVWQELQIRYNAPGALLPEEVADPEVRLIRGYHYAEKRWENHNLELFCRNCRSTIPDGLCSNPACPYAEKCQDGKAPEPKGVSDGRSAEIGA